MWTLIDWPDLLDFKEFLAPLYIPMPSSPAALSVMSSPLLPAHVVLLVPVYEYIACTWVHRAEGSLWDLVFPVCGCEGVCSVCVCVRVYVYGCMCECESVQIHSLYVGTPSRGKSIGLGMRVCVCGYEGVCASVFSITIALFYILSF